MAALVNLQFPLIKEQCDDNSMSDARIFLLCFASTVVWITI